MSDTTIPTLRLWIYRLIAVILIPLLFIFCLEGGLRLLKIGHSLNFTSDCSIDGKGFFCENTRFIERFFTKDIARQPASFTYAKTKQANTFRIFVLGASAAQGDPEFSYGFSRILKQLLKEKFPTVSFEIINTSISATNSHVVLPIAREVSQHQPDLAIVYLGNNEVVGPFGAGTIFAPIAANRSLIRAGIYLKTTRIGQLIDTFAQKLKAQKNPGEWRGMEMFLGNQVRFDATELEMVYAHYQDNLFDIINTFSKQHTPVIISTVGTNLKDFPTLGSQHTPGLSESDLKQWKDLFRNGLEQLQTGQLDQALEKLSRAEQIDANYGELQFLLGQVQLRINNLDEAQKHFITARNLDTLRFRADSRINQIIRKTADSFSTSDVTLMDTAEMFNQLSPLGSPGNELFYEHVHLTFHGNYLLALSFAEQITQKIKASMEITTSTKSFLTEQECKNRLALGPFDQLRLNRLILSRMEGPPFIDQLWAVERVEKLTLEESQLQASLTSSAIKTTDSLYRQAIIKSPADPWLRLNYGVFLKSRNNLTAAIKQFLAALKVLPQSYKLHRYLSDSYIAIERWDQALPHYQSALDQTQVTADRTKLHLSMAYAQARLKHYEKSMATYRIALKEDPNSADNIYHAMGKLKLSTGNLSEARKMLYKAIEYQKGNKNTADLYFNYGYVLNKLKEPKQAKDAYQKALDLYRKELANTTDTQSHESLLIVLGRSSFSLGQVKEGRDYLQQAIAINPTEINHHLTLITALARHNQYAQAKLFLDQARQHMLATGNNEALRQLKTIEIQLN